jgi:hypothetical protein
VLSSACVNGQGSLGDRQSAERGICLVQKKAMFVPSGGRANLGLAHAIVVGAGVVAAVARSTVGRVPKQLQNLSQGFELPTVQLCVCYGCGRMELHCRVWSLLSLGKRG